MLNFGSPSPATFQQSDPKQVAAELAGVEKAVAEKERELADLRRKAQALRDQLAPGQAPGKVYKSLAELFEDMPQDAQPLPGTDGTIERVAANKWMAKHFAGRTLEIQATVTGIEIDEIMNSDKWRVRVHYEIDSQPAWGGITLKGFAWKCSLASKRGPGSYPQLLYVSSVGEAAAKQVRSLKGKSVALRWQVGEAKFASGEVGRESLLRLEPRYGSVTFDGFSPFDQKPAELKQAK